MQARGFQQHVCVFNIEGILCPLLENTVEGLKDSNLKQHLCHMTREDCLNDECRFFKDCWEKQE